LIIDLLAADLRRLGSMIASAAQSMSAPVASGAGHRIMDIAFIAACGVVIGAP
jgi:hypothetical protein